jgi:hypothetical protein
MAAGLSVDLDRWRREPLTVALELQFAAAGSRCSFTEGGCVVLLRLALLHHRDHAASGA